MKRLERYSQEFRVFKKINWRSPPQRRSHRARNLSRALQQFRCNQYGEVGTKTGKSFERRRIDLDCLLGGRSQLYFCHRISFHEERDDDARPSTPTRIIFFESFSTNAVARGNGDRCLLSQGSVLLLGESPRKEKSLTQDIGFASDSHIKDSSIPPSAPVVPALSTKFEAERAVNMYLERVRQRLQDRAPHGNPDGFSDSSTSLVIFKTESLSSAQYRILSSRLSGRNKICSILQFEEERVWSISNYQPLKLNARSRENYTSSSSLRKI